MCWDVTMGCNFSRRLRKKRKESDDRGRNGAIGVGQSNEAHDENPGKLFKIYVIISVIAVQSHILYIQ